MHWKFPKSFRPLSGNLLSLPAQGRWKKGENDAFSSPIGESTFSTDGNGNFSEFAEVGFRPLSGNLLSLLYWWKEFDTYKVGFSSPIGESTFSTSRSKSGWEDRGGFRPLSGNLLSLPAERNYGGLGGVPIFVPYRGIYFLYKFMPLVKEICNMIFVPYRGIYFLYPLHFDRWKQVPPYFRPLSGNLLSLLDGINEECLY